MMRFVVGEGHSQSTLLRDRLEDYSSEDNPVRAIDVLSMTLICEAMALGGAGRAAASWRGPNP